MTRMTGPDCAVMCNLINTPPREDQCEWHRMTRMTGPDCVVMCNLINIHTHTHTHTHTYTTYFFLQSATVYDPLSLATDDSGYVFLFVTL